MTLGTLVRYLQGDRAAIEEILTSRHALALGLVFVLSAGFAREYDGEDLLHEPWHLLIPLGASLATAALLYLLLRLVALFGGVGSEHFWTGYERFVRLYWMTAPMAWLYAIPVERFLPAGDATRMNLAFLALVSLWRVLLITRAAAVLFRARQWQMLFVVMLFADSLALFLLTVTPLPVISFMGGIRLSESERLLQGTAVLIGLLGAVTWPLWLIGSIVVGIWFNKQWKLYLPPIHTAEALSWPLRSLAGAALLVWIPLLVIAQPEQQRRREVEQLMRTGEIAAALELMSQHPPHAFPPHWDPPPRLAYHEFQPPMLEIMEAVVAQAPAPWVQECFLHKMQLHMNSTFSPDAFWETKSSEVFDRTLAVLEHFPELVAGREEVLRRQLEDKQRTETQKERLQQLLYKTMGD